MKTVMLFLLFTGFAAQATDLPKHQVPPSSDGSMVLGNCDGKGAIEIKGKKPGDQLSRTEAQDAANKMMKMWSKQHPGADWKVADSSDEKAAKKEEARKKSPPAEDVNEQASREAKKEKVTNQQGAYSNYSVQDLQTWDLEQQKLVNRGKELFHDGTKMGGTTGIACAMCHPDASNTHPETYPKYQVQLQRVAFLRDMINWCMENPLKAKALKDDDPRLRAVEAYIISQRKGTALYPGKH